MRVFSILMLVFIIWSCDSSTKQEQKNVVTKMKTTTEAIKELTFLSKVFDAGALNVLNQDCSFNTDCDCCHDEMIINADSSMYYMAFCENKVRLLKGFIRSKGNGYYEFVFDGYIETRYFNQDSDEDETKPKFDPIMETIPIFTKRVFLTQCNGLAQFVFVEETNSFYAIENGKLYNEAVSKWNWIREK